MNKLNQQNVKIYARSSLNAKKKVPRVQKNHYFVMFASVEA